MLPHGLTWCGRIAMTSSGQSPLRFNPLRHPELVSGSIPPPAPPVLMARWMLKRVQHDELGERGVEKADTRTGWFQTETRSAISAPPQHERIFGHSPRRYTPIRHPELVSGSIPPPAPPVLMARWMLKRVQHDELGGRGGEKAAQRTGCFETEPRSAISAPPQHERIFGQSPRRFNPLRHPELVSGSIPPPAPPVLMARWMLKRVQHDELGGVGTCRLSAPRQTPANQP